MKEVAMKVNQANLVKGLKYSFTNKTTVLGELMQNARRAGASQVVFDFDPENKMLRVSDDGCGIDSIETLLTVAESGWNADMCAEEHPFGIGFLSALFACRHLTVSTIGGCISAKTEDVLSFLPVVVTHISNWDGITEIIMQDVNLEEDDIRKALEKLIQGFPIPVVFNNEELKSLLSINSGLQFVDTEIGSVYLSGLDTPPLNRYRSHDYAVFLQGLPIYNSREYWHVNNNHYVHVIHLDSTSFYARLPDREKLINQDEVIEKIKQVLAKEIESRLVSMKITLSAKEFVCFYPIMKDWKLERLLNDVPLIPAQVLSEVSDNLVCNTDAFGSFITEPKDPLSRDEIKARGIVSINDDLQYEGAAHYLFVWKKNLLLYNGNLDAGHWIHALVKNLDKDEATIEIINESHRASFRGSWVWLSVCFCDAYRIHIGDETVEISDVAFYTGQENDDTAFIPKGGDSSDVLKQAYSFNNEFEEFQDSAWENDSDAFESFIVANTSKEPADAIKRLLPNFTECPLLYGESFVLTLDKEGKVALVTAAA